MVYPAAHFDEALRSKPEGRGFDSLLDHRDFSLTYFLWPHYELEVDSAPIRIAYQEFLPRGKDGLCVRLNLITFMCPLFKNSANLNFLEPQEPVQAWNNFTFACFIFAPFFDMRITRFSQHQHPAYKVDWLVF
jgi:hypothetical protein